MRTRVLVFSLISLLAVLVLLVGPFPAGGAPVPSTGNEPGHAQGMRLLFSDDFSSDLGWIDESGSTIYRDESEQWLVWQMEAGAEQRYYVPLGAASELVRLTFRYKITQAGDSRIFFGLAEQMDGAADFTSYPSGFFVTLGYDTSGLAYAQEWIAYQDRPSESPVGQDAFLDMEGMGIWRQINLVVDNGEWALTAYDDRGTQLDQTTGRMSGTHEGYPYLMLFYSGAIEEEISGLLDDVQVYGSDAAASGEEVPTESPPTAAATEAVPTETPEATAEPTAEVAAAPAAESPISGLSSWTTTSNDDGRAFFVDAVTGEDVTILLVDDDNAPVSDMDVTYFHADGLEIYLASEDGVLWGGGFFTHNSEHEVVIRPNVMQAVNPDEVEALNGFNDRMGLYSQDNYRGTITHEEYRARFHRMGMVIEIMQRGLTLLGFELPDIDTGEMLRPIDEDPNPPQQWDYYETYLRGYEGYLQSYLPSQPPTLVRVDITPGESTVQVHAEATDPTNYPDSWFGRRYVAGGDHTIFEGRTAFSDIDFHYRVTDSQGQIVAEADSFAPDWEIDLGNSPGDYTLAVTAIDEVGNGSDELMQGFTLRSSLPPHRDWTVGLSVMVANPSGAWLRAAANPEGAVLFADLLAGASVTISGGPEYDGVQWWWEVQDASRRGWVEEASLTDESPCMAQTDQERFASLRVGPGENRTSLMFLPANQPVPVTGQAPADDGSRWWQVDIADRGALWVAQSQVSTFGACGIVPEVTPPGLIPPAPDSGSSGSSGGPALGTGEVQVTLSWNNAADLDLSVTEPSGERIYFGDRNSATGGRLDVDSNFPCGQNQYSVENIYWPTGQAPSGTYRVRVNQYSVCGGSSASWTLTVRVNGQAVLTRSGTGGTADYSFTH